MANWHDYAVNGQIPLWPYPIKYANEQVIETDVLVLGGGMPDAGTQSVRRAKEFV